MSSHCDSVYDVPSSDLYLQTGHLNLQFYVVLLSLQANNLKQDHNYTHSLLFVGSYFMDFFKYAGLPQELKYMSQTLQWVGASKVQQFEQVIEPYCMMFKELKEKNKQLSSLCCLKENTKKLNTFLEGGGGGGGHYL